MIHLIFAILGVVARSFLFLFAARLMCLVQPLLSSLQALSLPIAVPFSFPPPLLDIYSPL